MAKISVNVPDGYNFTAVVNGVPYTLPVGDITPQSLLYVIEYGFQRAINDRTGGSDKTADDKAKIASAMIGNFANKDWTPGSRGVGVDPIVQYVRAIIRDIVKGKKESAATYKALAPDARDEYLDGIFAKQSPEKQAALRATAEKRKAVDDKRRADAAKLSEGVELTV